MDKSSLMVMNPDEMFNLAELIVNTVQKTKPDATANEILDVVICTTAALVANICRNQPDMEQSARMIGDKFTKNIFIMLDQVELYYS